MPTPCVETDTLSLELNNPFTMLIAGPTKCGKTSFVEKLVVNAAEYYKTQPNKIIYYYNQVEPSYEGLQTHVHDFREGVPSMDDLETLQNEFGPNCTVIIDDQAMHVNTNMAELFSVGSSRQLCNIVFITQNLFGQAKGTRDISLNCCYIVLFKNPRDASAAQIFFKQYDPGHSNNLLKIYKDATDKPYSYLFMDLHQVTPDANRLRSNIFGENNTCPILYRY